MIVRLLTGLLLVPFLTASGYAGEAEDAINLLKASLRCPLKANTEGVHDINEYVGDQHTFRIRTDRMEAEHTLASEKVTATAKYSSLIFPTQVRGNSVVAQCNRIQFCVLFADDASGLSNKQDELDVDLCDSETAENVKAAMDALIKLNSR